MLVEHGNGTVVINLAPDQGLIDVSGGKIMDSPLNDAFMPGAPQHFAAVILRGLVKDRQRNWHWRYCDGSGFRLNKGSGRGFNCGHGVFLSNFRLGQSIAEIHHQ